MSAKPKRERSRGHGQLASRAVQAAFVIILVGLWYIGTTHWRISPILLPNPVAVWHELRDVLSTGEYIPDLRITLTELAIAFSISSTAGITLGYLISRSRYSIRVFEPLLAGIYSVPIILFLPLYILFFGLGPASKIALGATISFFPIVLNTIAGFGYVDLHRRAPVHPRQRDHCVAGGPRPPHRASRRGHGYRADVCLHRLCRRHCSLPQYGDLVARGPGKAALDGNRARHDAGARRSAGRSSA
jgi:hypothetical protein